MLRLFAVELRYLGWRVPISGNPAPRDQHVDGLQVVDTQDNVKCSEDRLELVAGWRAQYGNHVLPLREQPGDRELRDRGAPVCASARSASARLRLCSRFPGWKRGMHARMSSPRFMRAPQPPASRPRDSTP